MDKIRKVIPALDVTDLKQIEKLIEAIDSQDVIYGYKAGFSLGLTHGLPKVVESIRRYSQKPIIYDHQKAATDIPDTGKLFAQTMKNSGIDEVILFPQAGPATLEAWVQAVQKQEMKVIVGGIMTHPKFVVSEGGFIRDEAVIEMYQKSRQLNVNSFVVPLTKPDAVKNLYREAGLDENCAFYSPGFGKQGGDAAQFAFLKTHYMIIGRSLLQSADPLNYLLEVKRELQTI